MHWSRSRLATTAGFFCLPPLVSSLESLVFSHIISLLHFVLRGELQRGLEMGDLGSGEGGGGSIETHDFPLVWMGKHCVPTWHTFQLTQFSRDD